MGKILCVDDDRGLRKGIALALKRHGHQVTEASNGLEGQQRLQDESFDLMITDLEMPGLGGLALLKVARQLRPDTTTMVISGFGTIEKAVEAMKEGAQDFITKGDSFSIDELEVKVDRVLRNKAIADENKRLTEENRVLRETVHKRYHFKNIIGRSHALQEVFTRLEKLAPDAQIPVLVHGESGTGKELIARALHFNGPRKDRPFLTVHCAALPQALLEAELFGQEPDSSSGTARIGKLEAADGGSLFLDEVTQLSLPLQVKLLRVLQERTFERLGSLQPRPIDVRLIAATSQDLQQALQAQQFRSDLYYRLNVVPLRLPPLRERRQDLPLLLEHFLELNRRERNRRLTFAPAALDALLRYDWPGNVREMENLIEQLALLAPGEVIEAKHLPSALLQQVAAKSEPPLPASPASFKAAKKRLIEDFERRFIHAALDQNDWNVTKAAADLGESREGLHRKIKRYKLQRNRH